MDNYTTSRADVDEAAPGEDARHMADDEAATTTSTSTVNSAPARRREHNALGDDEDWDDIRVA